MENATTVILPVGDFTWDILGKVSAVLDAAAARRSSIVISLQWTARWSWGALCQLAESLSGRYRDARVCFTCVTPAQRALFGEVGLGGNWIVEQAPPAARRILIAA